MEMTAKSKYTAMPVSSFSSRGGGVEATYNKHKYYYSGKEFICNCSTAKSVEDDDENENRISPPSLPGP